MTGTADGGEQRAPSSAYRHYVLAALSAVYMLNLVDRGLMMLLLEPIKLDLDLSDTQLGLVTGIVFGLFYATVGIPIARLADRGNRAIITAVAIGVWGLTVMACLWVTSFVQLAAARMAAAVGEAGCKPPAYSLVGDYFPASSERTRAMAIFLGAGSFSSLFSFMAGGWLNELYGWRMTFFLMGIPGLALALLVWLTVREPRRHATDDGMSAGHSMRQILALLWRRRSCRYLCLGLIALYTMSLGLGPWYAAFLIRSHGIGTGELGTWLGLIFGLGGGAGALLGGYLGGHVFHRSEITQVRFTALSVGALVPCFLLFLLAPGKLMALLALIPLAIVFSVFLGPTYALLQSLVPDDTRATTMALVMFLTNLIGMGIGPQLVGIASDLLAPSFGSDSLRYAMLIISAVAVGAAYLFWQAGATVRDDILANRPPARSRAPWPESA